MSLKLQQNCLFYCSVFINSICNIYHNHINPVIFQDMHPVYLLSHHLKELPWAERPSNVFSIILTTWSSHLNTSLLSESTNIAWICNKIISPPTPLKCSHPHPPGVLLSPQARDTFKTGQIGDIVGLLDSSHMGSIFPSVELG